MDQNITIDIPDASLVKSEVAGIIEVAQAIKIKNTEDRQGAAAFERALIAKEKTIAAHYKPIKQSLDKHKRVILDQERGYLAPIREAREIVKRTELSWDNEQRRIAEEARKAEEAKLRKQEEDKRIAAAEAAENSGNAAKAEAILETPIEVPKVKIDPPKQQGQSVRTTWKAEVVDFSKLLAYVAANPVLAHLVKPDEQAIRAMVRIEKDAFKLPGVRAYSEKSLTTRL